MKGRRPDTATQVAIIAVTAALAAVLLLRLRNPRPVGHVGPGYYTGGRR